MSHPVATFDPDDFCHEEDDAASPVVDPVSEQEMIDEELRDKIERRRKFHTRRVIAVRHFLKGRHTPKAWQIAGKMLNKATLSPRLPQGRHALNYDSLRYVGRRNREIDDGGLD
jgi:hypothetical protein